MMATIQTNNTVSDQLMATMNGTKKKTDTSVEDAENRFMTLLVSQMQNQDPLNPLDNAEVTSQLAQLSTVKGVNNLNTTLESLKNAYQTSQTLQAASMIGHSVLTAGSTISLADGNAIYGVELGQKADKVQVTIRDAAGAVVRTMKLDSAKEGVTPLSWDGKTDAGTAAANGTYKFEVKASSNGSKVDATALSFGQISSVATGASGIKLESSTLGTFNLSDVRRIF